MEWNVVNRFLLEGRWSIATFRYQLQIAVKVVYGMLVPQNSRDEKLGNLTI